MHYPIILNIGVVLPPKRPSPNALDPAGSADDSGGRCPERCSANIARAGCAGLTGARQRMARDQQLGGCLRIAVVMALDGMTPRGDAPTRVVISSKISRH